MAAKSKKSLQKSQRDELLTTLQTRFEENMHRHKGIKWDNVRERLEAQPGKLWSLHEMERTGGEPDVVRQDGKTKNTSSSIAPRRARKAAGACATTAKRWKQGRRTSPKPAR